jgi:hypothetical protein
VPWVPQFLATQLHRDGAFLAYQLKGYSSQVFGMHTFGDRVNEWLNALAEGFIIK